MGSLNFILSAFEYLLGRNPSEAEQGASVLMVDGFYTVLFNKEGNSKDDFLDIFLGSDAYFEGQVRDIYRRYVFREPNSVEMQKGTVLYKQELDYRALVKLILSSDEYLGV